MQSQSEKNGDLDALFWTAVQAYISTYTSVEDVFVRFCDFGFYSSILVGGTRFSMTYIIFNRPKILLEKGAR